MTNPWPPDLKFSYSIFERDPQRFPLEDEQLGRALFQDLHRKSFLGNLEPHLWIMRKTFVECLGLMPTSKYSPQRKRLLIAGIAGGDNIDAIALSCSFLNSEKKRAGMCFVEWADNRWWHGWQSFSEEGSLLSGFPIVKRALDKHPKPMFLGGWFSIARRTGLRMNLSEHVEEKYH